MTQVTHDHSESQKAPATIIITLTLIILALMLLPLRAFGQASSVYDIVLDTAGHGVPGATIRLCQNGAINTPCTPLALLYTSISATVLGPNPVTTNAFGNWHFYAKPGLYTLQITTPGGTQTFQDYQISPNVGNIPSLTVGKLNNTIYVDQEPGADFGAKVNQCVADLPTFGGICDATGFSGQSITAVTPIVLGTNGGKQISLRISSSTTVNFDCRLAIAAPCYNTDVILMKTRSSIIGVGPSCCASGGMFQITDGSVVSSLLHISNVSLVTIDNVSFAGPNPITSAVCTNALIDLEGITDTDTFTNMRVAGSIPPRTAGATGAAIWLHTFAGVSSFGPMVFQNLVVAASTVPANAHMLLIEDTGGGGTPPSGITFLSGVVGHSKSDVSDVLIDSKGTGGIVGVRFINTYFETDGNAKTVPMIQIKDARTTIFDGNYMTGSGVDFIDISETFSTGTVGTEIRQLFLNGNWTNAVNDHVNGGTTISGDVNHRHLPHYQQFNANYPTISYFDNGTFTQNVVVGGQLRLSLFNVAGLPSALGAGAMVYATDGTPGSSPCTGSGNGAIAAYTGSVWACK